MEYPVLDMKATGARIKELRTDHNLKVREVAEFMGLESEQAVYKWQRGESLPTVDNLYALSYLFDTSVDDILRGEKERDDDPSLSFVKLLNFIYLHVALFSFFQLDQQKNSNKLACCDIPVGVVDQINIYSDVTISTSALRLVSEKNIRLSIVDKYGNLIGNYVPEGYCKSSVDFLKQALFYQSGERFLIAQKMEIANVHNLRANIKYYSRKNGHKLDQIVTQMTSYMDDMRNTQTIDELMLIEAKARQLYYMSFNEILKQEEFFFEKRTRRPPMDEINALISFGNTLLYNQVLQNIWKTSLDPRIGIIHATTRRNYSLNLDFADLFKPVTVDRVIFSLVNLMQIQAHLHFERVDNGAVYLNKDGKRIFIEEFEEKMADKIKVKDRSYTYKQLIEDEVRHFQKYISSGEKYKPYKYY